MNSGLIGLLVFFLLVTVFCIVEDYYKSKSNKQFEDRLAKYDKQKTKYDTSKK